MILNTIGNNYYKNYIFPVLVTKNPESLMVDEAREYYKILLIKSGICRFNLNDKEYAIIGSHILHLNDQDRICFHNAGDANIWIVLFRPEIVNASFTISVINDPNNRLTGVDKQDLFYMEQFKHNTPEGKKLYPLAAIDITIIENKIEHLNYLLEKQDTWSWPCLSRSYLYEILFALARRGVSENGDGDLENYSGHSKLTIDIIYYLQSCYNEKITIDSLAEKFHTNRTTLHNDFKKHTGMSINQYLVQLRIGMAAKLLRDTGLSMSEICERIGFNDTGYFSKIFKKKFNQTPSEYRHISKAKIFYKN